MMEFTVNGIVRQAFGFGNPNHAAALICALIPLCWGWKKYAQFGYALSILLIVPLAMTFSRTGAIVLAFEFVAYLLLSHRNLWKRFWLFAIVSILVFALVGIQSRFALDKAVTNRPQIWLAGLKLAAANPLGVGLGNSGKIASAFLLDGINVRTLVNSHLTLLCELGIPAAFFWFLFLFHALVNGYGKVPAVWCSFAGLCLSALSASVFDWPVLFDFREHGGLSVSNFVLSWLTLGLFVVSGAMLGVGGIRRRKVMLCTMSSLMLSCFVFVFFSNETPQIKDGLVVLNRHEKDKRLFLYDCHWNLRDVRQFVQPRTSAVIPVDSCEGLVSNVFPKADTIVMFGECASFYTAFPNAQLIFVSPPEFIEFPLGTKKVYLKRYVEERFLQDVETDYY